MKRTGKFYRKNEAEVMKSLGLKPTKNSGSGWVEKEDGQNDFVICQLKSTDAQSIKINQKDIRMLEHNAAIEHKMPVFAIQFLNTREVWLMVKPEDLSMISKYIGTGTPPARNFVEADFGEYFLPYTGDEKGIKEAQESVKKISSSGAARKQFYDELNRQHNKARGAK